MRMLFLVLVACVLVAHAHIPEVPTNTSSAQTRNAVENAGLTVLSTLLGIFLLFVIKESPLSPLAVPPLPNSPVGPYPPLQARELHFMNNSFQKEIDHHDIKKRSLWRVGSGVSSVLNAAHMLALLSGIYLMIFVMEPVSLPQHVAHQLKNPVLELPNSNDIDVFSSRISLNNLNQNTPRKPTNEGYPSRPPINKYLHRNSSPLSKTDKDSTLNLKKDNERVIRPKGVVESLNPTGIGKSVNTTKIRP